jgi:hypothetical protein
MQAFIRGKKNPQTEQSVSYQRPSQDPEKSAEDLSGKFKLSSWSRKPRKRQPRKKREKKKGVEARDQVEDRKAAEALILPSERGRVSLIDC